MRVPFKCWSDVGTHTHSSSTELAYAGGYIVLLSNAFSSVKYLLFHCMKGNCYIYLNKFYFLFPNSENYSLSEFMRREQQTTKSVVSKGNKINYTFLNANI